MKKNLTLIKEIQRTAFNLLMDLTHLNDKDPAFGLTLDHNEKPGIASIATTGFVLSGYIIAVEYGYLTYEEALNRVVKTLHTLRYEVDHHQGFFAHFVDIKTGKRYKKSEFSTIDTALALNGIIAVSSYFKETVVKEHADAILNRVNWSYMIADYKGKKVFRMAYNPNEDGDYVSGGSAGFIFQWHMLAEQLMMYVFYAGNATDPALAQALYESFERNLGYYQQHAYYYSPGNTLFIYQYPLAWLDLRSYVDKDGISWFDNAASATKGHRAWNLRNMHRFKTFNRKTFGLTASSSPTGYSVFHAIPSQTGEPLTDGTVAPNAMIGSLPLTPELSLEAITYMKTIPGLWSDTYGFADAYNFEKENWISKRYITIDKGLELLMVNAYLSEDVWRAYMSHPLIKKGIEVLQWRKK